MRKKYASKNIIKQRSSIEYFKNLVEDAIENQNIEIEEMEEFYIVNLLTEHIRTDRVYINLENSSREEPLANILFKALQAEYYEERIKIFKKLGDFTLFISGYFSDSLNRKLIDIDYYKAIGESAYSNLSYLTKKRKYGEMFSGLFEKLAKRFQSLVDIIAEVSDKSLVKSDKGILRVYERWIRTGGRRDASILMEKGIIPIQQDNNYLQ